MKTYIFGTEYIVFISQANSREEAIEKVRLKLIEAGSDKFDTDSFEQGLINGFDNNEAILNQGETMIYNHSNM